MAIDLTKCGLEVRKKLLEGEILSVENKELKKVLERISGMCGHPDAIEACRNILKVIKDAR